MEKLSTIYIWTSCVLFLAYLAVGVVSNGTSTIENTTLSASTSTGALSTIISTTVTTTNKTPDGTAPGRNDAARKDNHLMVWLVAVSVLLVVAVAIFTVVGLLFHRRVRQCESEIVTLKSRISTIEKNWKLREQKRDDDVELGPIVSYDSTGTQLAKQPPLANGHAKPEIRENEVPPDLKQNGKCQTEMRPKSDEAPEKPPSSKDVKPSTRSSTKTFSAYFGASYADIFTDITDTAELYRVCQDYFQNEQVEDEPGNQEYLKEVRESIIEKVELLPVHEYPGNIFAAGYENKGYETDEVPRTPRRPESYHHGSVRRNVLGRSPRDNFDTINELEIDTPDFIELSAMPLNGEETMMPSLLHSTLDYSHGMFSRKVIGPAGGEIQVCEIKLTVPAGALLKEKEICLGLIWQPESMPRLLPKQAMLSPVVVCEPHGLQFHTPVKLTIPHCAHRLRTDWDITLMKSETTIGQATQWKPLTLVDYAERDILNNNIQLSLYHFTLYTVIGESKENTVAAKAVKLVAFAPPLNPGKLFKIRVYCVNNYNKEMEDIRKDERELVGHRLDAPVPLFMHDTGKNLCLEVENVSEGWAMDTKKQELIFDHVWHGLSPHCTLVIRPEGTEGKSEIICNIKAYQAGNPDQLQRITIAEETRTDILHGITTPPGTYSVFPYDLRRKLIMTLDPNSLLGRDWHAVASYMDLDYTMVTWLESQTSPTEMLLRQWETENRTLFQFHEAMKNIEQLDLAEEVEQYILKKEAIC